MKPHPSPDDHLAPATSSADEVVGRVVAPGSGTGPVPPRAPRVTAGLTLLPDVAAEDGRDARLAMVAYLAVPFFGFVVPLVIYLASLRRSRWLRGHAAQALNVWFAVLLYEMSAAVMGGMLSLDAIPVAVAVVLPALAALWLVTLALLLRAASRAGRGGDFTFPAWLCARLAR